ncbi:hypothetical protein GGR50DRAFT_697072 [Xylaria sp. CBS 124048]|nr:hypothetical protein GGR50DRAFT_697072 [Xylaria sp. CBS 124048]
MASYGRSTGGRTLKALGRARSSSLSSDSSLDAPARGASLRGAPTGGASLHVDLSDLNLDDGPRTHRRSISELAPPRTYMSDLSVTNGSHVDTTPEKQNFQVGTPHGDDDVFNTDSSTPEQVASPVVSSGTVAGRSTTPAPIMKETISTSQALVVANTQLTPSEHRHLVQGIDAQTYYPAEACIFVANLPESKSDEALEVAVTRGFSIYGPVFVKIRRDPKNMPFAFCQYTDAAHARRAQSDGKGLLIEGRPCRTEMVKANRCYVMFSRKGFQVNLTEARSHLLQFGEISKLEPLREEAVNTMKLPGAVFVEYQHFDPGRDIISAYRYNDEFGIVAYDLKRVNTNQVNHHANYLARYEVDRRSIYVGNLPHGVDNLEGVLTHAAAVAGNVKGVQVIRKDGREGGRTTLFAFIEFTRPDEALAAVEHLRGTMLGNNRLRVEKKKCTEQSNHIRAGEHHRTDRNQTAAVTASPMTPVKQIKANRETVPDTPARPTCNSMVPASDNGTGMGYTGPQAETGNYNPVIVQSRQVVTIPTEYSQVQTAPEQELVYYQDGSVGPVAYDQIQHSQPLYTTQHGQQPYGQQQFVAVSETYAPGQYVSPRYALSSSGQQRPGQVPYNPATPQLVGGAHVPYHGSAGPYYPGQQTPHWPTPYLQDQNSGFQYYAGYPMHRQYTPIGMAGRPAHLMPAMSTPTRRNGVTIQLRNRGIESRSIPSEHNGAHEHNGLGRQHDVAVQYRNVESHKENDGHGEKKAGEN